MGGGWVGRGKQDLSHGRLLLYSLQVGEAGWGGVGGWVRWGGGVGHLSHERLPAALPPGVRGSHPLEPLLAVLLRAQPLRSSATGSPRELSLCLRSCWEHFGAQSGREQPVPHWRRWQASNTWSGNAAAFPPFPPAGLDAPSMSEPPHTRTYPLPHLPPPHTPPSPAAGGSGPAMSSSSAPPMHPCRRHAGWPLSWPPPHERHAMSSSRTPLPPPPQCMIPAGGAGL